jgi:hypothetical protein
MAQDTAPRKMKLALRRKSPNENGHRPIYLKRNAVTYKTKFIIVVFLKCGPSLVGKLHVLKIPP